MPLPVIRELFYHIDGAFTLVDSSRIFISH
jgi:hypothetical protein